MKTVILCGGKGTRIRGIKDELPKPMIPIGEFPILWHIMNHYAYYGHKEFVLCLGYLGWHIKNYFLNFKTMVSDFTVDLNRQGDVKFTNDQLDLDWKITMAETGENAMTGARIRKIRRYVEKDSHFMLTYGDGLSDVKINELIEFHKSQGKTGTVTGVRPSGRFGEIEVSGDNQVVAFNEKPQITAGRINGGFFIFDSKKIWDYLPEGDDIVFELEPLRQMAVDGELAMYPHDGFWQPMDTYREYKILNGLWEKGKSEKHFSWPGQIRF